MGSAAQNRAVSNYRKRLKKRGMVRFEVLGLKSDRDLLRSLARKLAEDDQEAESLRTQFTEDVKSGPRKTGGILAMLQSAPMSGIELNISRKRTAPRKVDL
jgi:hypothetical protein